MVNLINVKVVDGIITADYYPESNFNDIGRLSYNIDNDEASFELCQTDINSGINTYATKAIQGIKRLLSKGEQIPRNFTQMWY